jgi:fructose-1,6-bisphosphatase/inositol monophosphatase family enzyme
VVIVNEAGGKISTFGGGDYDIFAPDIAVSNEVLHQELLACLARSDS